MKIFNEPINVTKPLVPNEISAAEMLSEVIASGWLTNNGPKHSTLQSNLKEFLNVENISLFSNGTLALILALRALNLKGEVITTPFTFPATLEALDWNNLKPVFCDVEPTTYNINPEKIEKLITKETTAILAVHVFGNPCDVKTIQDIAERYDLKVIYDGAHAFGVNVNEIPVGQYGDITMFSFHATKLFNTVEGGGLVYKDENLIQKLDLLKNFGIKSEQNIALSGLNAKLNEVQAGFGIEVLKEVEKERSKRHKVKQLYEKELEKIEGIRIITSREGNKSSYQYFAVEIETTLFGCDRDVLYESLKSYNIFTKKYFNPLCSTFEWYRDLESAKRENLPVANEIVDKVLILPFYGDLKDNQVTQICRVIQEIHTHYINRREKE